MSAQPVPVRPRPGIDLEAPSFTSSSTSPSTSAWDRFTTWASENKALVYTIAGVAVVVTGAGVVYYLRESRGGEAGGAVAEEKRKSKKERRKEKKKAEEEKKASENKIEEEPGTRRIPLRTQLCLPCQHP